MLVLRSVDLLQIEKTMLVDTFMKNSAILLCFVHWFSRERGSIDLDR